MIDVLKKICIECRKEKFLDEFQWRKDTGKYRNVCKKCCNIYNKQYRQDNKEQINARDRQRYQDNKEQINTRHKQHYRNNKEKVRTQQRQYENSKRQSDIQFKLKKTLRRRMWSALKNNFKVGSAVSDLSCSIEDLKLWLEKWFYNNPKTGEIMTWENYGRCGWHIDHIKPLSKFDLTDREQFLEACNFKNLQPMWAEENLSKGNKLCVIGLERIVNFAVKS